MRISPIVRVAALCSSAVFLAVGPSRAASYGGAAAASTRTPPSVNRSCPTPRPELSEAAQHRNEQGDVLVGVYVSSHGRPRKVAVAQSSGFKDLDNAAAAAVAGWRFHPAMIGDTPVSDWLGVKFHFAPQDPSETQTPIADASGACSS
jgi:periplasmic protein TonB